MTSALLVSGGCYTYHPPAEQVASVLANARGAQEVGALEIPEAVLHLRLAMDQIARAQLLMESNKHRRAEDLAIRAYQDVELALALTREDALRRRLDRLAQRLAMADPPSAAPEPETPAMPEPTVRP